MVRSVQNYDDCLLTHWCWKKSGRHFADDIFKCIFMNESVWISIKSSLKIQIKTFQYWFGSHYLNQWWLVYWRIYALLGLTWSIAHWIASQNLIIHIDHHWCRYCTASCCLPSYHRAEWLSRNYRETIIFTPTQHCLYFTCFVFLPKYHSGISRKSRLVRSHRT